MHSVQPIRSLKFLHKLLYLQFTTFINQFFSQESFEHTQCFLMTFVRIPKIRDFCVVIILWKSFIWVCISGRNVSFFRKFCVRTEYMICYFSDIFSPLINRFLYSSYIAWSQDSVNSTGVIVANILDLNS